MGKKGFTLIELLIVIAILGVLSGIIIAVLNPARQRQRAQDANLISALGKIGVSVDAFYSAKARFPNNKTPLPCSGVTCELYDEIENETHSLAYNDVRWPWIAFSINGVTTADNGGGNRIWYFGGDYPVGFMRGTLVARGNIANSQEHFVWKSGQPIKVADLSCATTTPNNYQGSSWSSYYAGFLCNGNYSGWIGNCSTAVDCKVL